MVSDTQIKPKFQLYPRFFFTLLMFGELDQDIRLELWCIGPLYLSLSLPLSLSLSSNFFFFFERVLTHTVHS